MNQTFRERLLAACAEYKYYFSELPDIVEILARYPKAKGPTDFIRAIESESIECCRKNHRKVTTG